MTNVPEKINRFGTEKKIKNEFFYAVKLILTILLSCFAFWGLSLGCLYLYKFFKANPEITARYASIIILTMGILMVIISIIGYVKSCPTCGKWFAKKFDKKTIVKKIKTYGLVTRTATTNKVNFGSTQSENISYHTSWEERVPIIKTTYHSEFHCKYCYHTWVKASIVEKEDFDVER